MNRPRFVVRFIYHLADKSNSSRLAVACLSGLVHDAFVFLQLFEVNNSSAAKIAFVDPTCDDSTTFGVGMLWMFLRRR